MSLVGDTPWESEVMGERKGGWMQTFSGLKFYPLDARPDEVNIEDIAHHLANNCRYGGATLGYYSVAQHSVLVSDICKPENAMWGLMHDAAEAYLGDMIRPLKHGPGMEEYRRIEKSLQKVVLAKFGLSELEPEDVEYADAVMLATEKRDLLRKPQTDMDETEWLHGASAERALSSRVWPLDPVYAEALFLERFHQLNNSDGGW